MNVTYNILNWLFAMMISGTPISKQAQETEIEATARYESIAQDVADVAFDENESPLFEGDNGRIKTAAVMIGIDNLESHYRKDVDVGSLRGDNNGSWCLAQINLNGGRIRLNPDGSFNYLYGNSVDGFSGRDLVQDRKKCFRAQLAILRASFKCNVPNENQKLNMYASGFCDRGAYASAERMNLARSFWNQTTLKDADVFAYLKEQREHTLFLEDKQ
jgi:hypothetical protein